MVEALPQSPAMPLQPLASSNSTVQAQPLASQAAPGASPSSAESSSGIHLRYKLASPTFKMLCTIQTSPDRRQVLHKACFATEFRLFPLKQAERSLFREINDHTGIPYTISELISQPWHKIFLLVQIDLQRTGWPNKISSSARKELHQERGRIYKLLDQVLRCLVDILGQRKDGRGVSVALDVLRSVHAGVWEGSDKELLQVEGIGMVKMNKLIQAGVKSVKKLAGLEFFHIERLLSRNPPFGHQVLHHLAGFPMLCLQIEVVGKYDSPEGSKRTEFRDGLSNSTEIPAPPVSSLCIVRVNLNYKNIDVPKWGKQHPWVTFVAEAADGRLVWFWRGSVKRLTGGKEMVMGFDAKVGEKLKVTFACEEIVGTMIRETVQM